MLLRQPCTLMEEEEEDMTQSLFLGLDDVVTSLLCLMVGLYSIFLSLFDMI